MRSLTLILLLHAGCGGATRLPEPNEYTGCGTDENWPFFDDREAAGQVTLSATLGPILTAPMGAVPSSTRPILAWSRGSGDPGMAAGDVLYLNGPGCNDCCPEFNLGGLQTLHLPAISGDVYDLQLLDGQTILWRVITTLQEWTPPPMPPAGQGDPWPSWRGKTITVKIFRMTVDADSPQQGPLLQPTPPTFTVGS